MNSHTPETNSYWLYLYIKICPWCSRTIDNLSLLLQHWITRYQFRVSSPMVASFPNYLFFNFCLVFDESSPATASKLRHDINSNTFLISSPILKSKRIGFKLSTASFIVKEFILSIRQSSDMAATEPSRMISGCSKGQRCSGEAQASQQLRRYCPLHGYLANLSTSQRIWLPFHLHSN